MLTQLTISCTGADAILHATTAPTASPSTPNPTLMPTKRPTHKRSTKRPTSTPTATPSTVYPTPSERAKASAREKSQQMIQAKKRAQADLKAQFKSALLREHPTGRAKPKREQKAGVVDRGGKSHHEDSLDDDSLGLMSPQRTAHKRIKKHRLASRKRKHEQSSDAVHSRKPPAEIVSSRLLLLDPLIMIGRTGKGQRQSRHGRRPGGCYSCRGQSLLDLWGWVFVWI